MTVQVTARQAAERVEQEQERLGRWQAEQAAAEAELVDLEARVGGEVLADPDAAEGLTEAMGRLRSRVDVAARAVAAAEARVDGARRGALRAEADELDAMAAGLRAQLDEREAHTADLLEALQDYTGAKWELARLVNSTTGALSSLTSTDRTAERLRGEIGKAEARARQLRAVADDPAAEPVTPEQAREAQREAERRRRLAEAPSQLAEAEAKVAELEKRKADGHNVDEWLHRVRLRVEHLREFLDRENVGA